MSFFEPALTFPNLHFISIFFSNSLHKGWVQLLTPPLRRGRSCRDAMTKKVTSVVAVLYAIQQLVWNKSVSLRVNVIK